MNCKIKERKKIYLDQLIRKVIFRIKGDPALGMDSDGLLELYAETGIALSTLKRIFGIDKSQPFYFPSCATLHRLAKYSGSENWNEFVRERFLAGAPDTGTDLKDAG